MGKKFKSKKPTNETLSTFKEIENYIKEEQESKRDKFTFKQKKIKMPYKMYMGIKNSVLKKHKQEEEFNKINSIIGQTKNQKLMTQIILGKHEKEKEKKQQKKLFISRNKQRSRFKDGVLNVGKNFKEKNNIK
jgi:hypothetical protein